MLTFVLLVLLVAACGGSENAETERQPAATKPAQAEKEEEGKDWLRAAAASGAADDARWAGLKKAAGPYASQLVYPHGTPPKETVFKDLRAGKGPTIDEWDRFALKYRRFDYKSGKLEEESSVHELTYLYGTGELVDAWEPGLKGMRAGGIRELVAPGSQVYGEPAVYVVELLDLVKEE